MIKAQGTDYFSVVNGVRLHYVDWGGSGRPILLLHGLQDTARNWEHIAQALTKNHHVYALDARGHGESEWVPGHYQFDQFVTDIAGILKAVDLQNVVLVGHSAGGKYAFTHTANDDSRVSGLVIIDMDPDPVNPGSGNMFIRYREEGDEWPDIQSVVERLRSREPNTDENVLHYLAEVMTNPLPDGRRVWKRDRQIVLEYERPDAWATLAKIKVNTLIIRGANSPLLRSDVAERMKDIIPSCTLVEIPNGGHWCLNENPDAVINQLENFIDQIRP